jgi:uroporphyrin-III C-methyltransferase/precorrin-2 dehydrogenase/sirohydrochlorin ferrochelatase
VRRGVIDAALREGGALDPLDPAAHERVEVWARDAGSGEMAARPVGPGPTVVAEVQEAALTRRSECHAITLTSADPEELTLRAARLLGEADTLLIDGDVPSPILARARADAARLPFEGNAAQGDRPGLTLILHWRPEAT